jgi:large subunit ribosomal protein L6
MSRIGKMPVPVPKGVTATLDGSTFRAKGPLGEMKVDVPQGTSVEIADGEIRVKRESDSKQHRSLHGLSRSLVNSAVVGVSQGYSRTLEIIGVGYRGELKGKNLVLHLGYSHPITVTPPAGIDLVTPDPTHVVVKGVNKQAVGQIAANIRALRPPEPYKGKGVKYAEETIRRKAGKTAAG